MQGKWKEKKAFLATYLWAAAWSSPPQDRRATPRHVSGCGAWPVGDGHGGRGARGAGRRGSGAGGARDDAGDGLAPLARGRDAPAADGPGGGHGRRPARRRDRARGRAGRRGGPRYARRDHGPERPRASRHAARRDAAGGRERLSTAAAHIALVTYSRSASASPCISSRRCLTTSPMLTIPHSRPSSSTTGTCRMRRSVISAMIALTRSSREQVNTFAVIALPTLSPSTSVP